MSYSIFILLLFFLFLFLFLLLKYKRANQSNYSTCCICEEVLKECDIQNVDELPFCEKHYVFFKQNAWKVVSEALASSTQSEGAMDIYQRKHLLQRNNIHCFIRTTYTENDNEIYSIFKLYCPEDFLDKANECIKNNIKKEGS